MNINMIPFHYAYSVALHDLNASTSIQYNTHYCTNLGYISPFHAMYYYAVYYYAVLYCRIKIQKKINAIVLCRIVFFKKKIYAILKYAIIYFAVLYYAVFIMPYYLFDTIIFFLFTL